MSQTKPGPASPQEEGSDAPTPPGGPQRQDAAGEVGPGDTGAGREAPESAEDQGSDQGGDQGGGTIDLDDEQPGPETDSEETAAQRENAEASTEQPSQ